MKPKIEWEEFIEQHDGMQLIMEQYDLTPKELVEAFGKGIGEFIAARGKISDE